MKYILTILIISFSLILCSCNNAESKDKENKDKAETISFAVKIDLFNSIENLVDKTSKKKYIDSYNTLNDIYKLSNKANIVSERSDPLAKKYMQTLNQLSEKIFNESNREKNDEINYSYEKSQLSLIASINNQNNKDNSSDSQVSDKGKTSEKGSGSSSSEGSSSEEDKTKIIIPNEEILKKYPEILITKYDDEINASAVDLLGYVSKITLDSKKENLTAIINREKYLLYKIKSLAKLDQYNEANDLILEAQSICDSLYLKVDEKKQEDVITLNAILKNIKLSLEEKKAVAVDLQAKIAIEIINNLSFNSK